MPIDPIVLNKRYAEIAPKLDRILLYLNEIARSNGNNNCKEIFDQDAFSFLKNLTDQSDYKTDEQLLFLINDISTQINNYENLDRASRNKIIAYLKSDPLLDYYVDKFQKMRLYGSYGMIFPIIPLLHNNPPNTYQQKVGMLYDVIGLLGVLMVLIGFFAQKYYYNKNYVTTNNEHFITWIDDLDKLLENKLKHNMVATIKTARPVVFNDSEKYPQAVVVCEEEKPLNEHCRKDYKFSMV